MKIVLSLLMLVTISFSAQEIPFRYVEGHRHDMRAILAYYNRTTPFPRPASEWQPATGILIERTKTGVLLRKFSTKPIYDPTPSPAQVTDRLGRIGLGVGPSRPYSAPYRRQIGTETNWGDFFHVANVPGSADLLDGTVLNCLVLRLPKPYDYRGGKIAAYDHGTVPTAAQQQEIAAFLESEAKEIADKRAAIASVAAADRAAKQSATDAKVVAAYRVRADAGDADAQYELALRYLSGKGVAKDYDAGTKLLEQASKQGHKKAAEKLKTLPRTATSPQPESPAK